jgi:alpha-galactosidase
LVLDLCRPEVRKYIKESVLKTLNSANISYVKWDMNRHISDAFSPALKNGGQFMHSYILGLYEILCDVCTALPHILFEGCASGGNRYDLGMLFYMPQTWASDDTDAYERQKIQTGFSYAYPLCTMGSHVSAVPNHQTLRKTSLDTRFNTAAFGLLGYELDLTQISARQKEDIKLQIASYKKHRTLLQHGNFYRLQNPFYEDACRWLCVSPDQKEAILGDFMQLLKPNNMQAPLKFAGLNKNTLYKITTRQTKIEVETFGGLINHVLPVHVNPNGFLVKMAGKAYRLSTENEEYTAYGDALCSAGLMRLQDFSGAGYSENLRLLHDFASRLYYAKQM